MGIESITIYSPLKEFEELEYFNPKEKFNGCIIIPTGELHDSGFMCMKFALTNIGKIVGCIGGGSDVVHINGIGGYGKYGKDYESAVISQKVPRVSWQIDCLPNGLLRIFSDHYLSIDDIICSSFSLYADEAIKHEKMVNV